MKFFVSLVTVCGAATFAVLAFLVPQLYDFSRQTETAVVNIMSSISASFIFFVLLDIGFRLREWAEQRAFKRFFGDLSMADSCKLVYPDFELNEECEKLIKDVSHRYRKHSTPNTGTRFIDVPQIVASNDLLGVVIVSTSLGKYLGKAPTLITDGGAYHEIQRYNPSFISFGMTSNIVTDLYQRNDKDPLFCIKDPDTNHPRIVVKTDGEERSFGRKDNYQHGIILRYRPHRQEFPGQTWFICAGIAAAGTPAAAWLLAHKWKEYHKRFQDSDFLVIFQTGNYPEASPQTKEVLAFSRPSEE